MERKDSLLCNMAISSPKYLDDNVSIPKDRSILFKIKAAEKLLYLLDTEKNLCKLATVTSFHTETTLSDIILMLHNRPKPHDISTLHNFALLTESYP